MTATFVPTSGWLAPLPEPSAPAYRLPGGAVDAHCHVFGPGAVFPYAPERKYTPADAGKADLFRLRDRLGVSRLVVVQATCHGADNSAMVDAVRSAGGSARGVATIRPTTSLAEIEDMHDAGVRGVRFNFVRRLVDPHPDSYYLPMVEAIAPFGWHVVVYLEAADLAGRRDLFAGLPVPVVVDHMGRPDVSLGVDSPQFGEFLGFMRDNPHVWTKVSCPERLSRTGPPHYADVVPFSRRIIEEFPDRVLWGSDWPHPNMTGHMPDDGHLVDLLPRVAPTEELRHRLLVDNPDRLYFQD